MNTIETAYRTFCDSRFPLPSEEEVADLERRLGVPLPPDFRQFILEYNGGTFTEPDIVPPSKDCPLECLTFMNGIGATFSVAELASQSNLTLFDDNYPCQVLPIGYTTLGCLIYLITHPDDRGTIGLKLPSSDKCFFLASGIEDFFALLHEPREELAKEYGTIFQ